MAQGPLLPKRRSPIDAGGAAAALLAKQPHLRVTVCATAPPRSSGHLIWPLRDCPQICEGLGTEDTQPRREASAPQRRRPGNYSSVAPNRRFPLRCQKSASFPSHAPSFLQLERRHCEERPTQPDSQWECPPSRGSGHSRRECSGEGSPPSEGAVLGAPALCGCPLCRDGRGAPRAQSRWREPVDGW